MFTKVVLAAHMHYYIINYAPGSATRGRGSTANQLCKLGKLDSFASSHHSTTCKLDLIFKKKCLLCLGQTTVHFCRANQRMYTSKALEVFNIVH